MDETTTSTETDLFPEAQQVGTDNEDSKANDKALSVKTQANEEALSLQPNNLPSDSDSNSVSTFE